MRRFATWTTGHRKTVILGWVVALVSIGMIAGSVGSDFTEDFSLPASDSQEAFDLLEERFPAQSGETATIVYKAPAGVEAPRVRRQMEGVFAAVTGAPHVSEVIGPYGPGGKAEISDDGRIAFATVQFDQPIDELEVEETERVLEQARGASRPGLQVEMGGQPVEEVRAEEEGGDISFAVGLMAAVVVLLI